MEMPRIVKPLSAYFCWNSISQGISTLQGPHQVAQKFTSTTLPLYCSRLTSAPLRSFNVKLGAAGFPLVSVLAPGAAPPWRPREAEETKRVRCATSVTVNTTTTAMSNQLVLFISPTCALERETIQKCQLTRQPRKAVGKNQRPYQQQQNAAGHLDGVQVLAEALVEDHELAHAQRGKQKGDGQAGGIRRQQEDSLQHS